MTALAAGGPLAQRCALVVAHPDDEAIGAGGQIRRFDNLVVIVASDGAPRDGRDMARLGFASLDDYRKARRDELLAALAAADAPRDHLIRLDLPDGELVFALEFLVATLAEIFTTRNIEIALTHCYEGGHPDHDALALAVAAAARRCAAPPAVIEMPFYRAGPQGWLIQSFDENGPPPVTLEIEGDAWRWKCAMIDAHRSQRDLLASFRRPLETFRLAPDHDFTQPPNAGSWLYDQVAPRVPPELWLSRARAMLDAELRQ